MPSLENWGSGLNGYIANSPHTPKCSKYIIDKHHMKHSLVYTCTCDKLDPCQMSCLGSLRQSSVHSPPEAADFSPEKDFSVVLLCLVVSKLWSEYRKHDFL